MIALFRRRRDRSAGERIREHMANASRTERASGGAVLDRAGVRAFYDRFGARQDTQAFYEDAAADDLIAHADFETAGRTYELGCGTGRFAQRLLERHLPADSAYLGTDLSTTMVQLARRRLARFAPRADVRLTNGAPSVEARDHALDRVVSLYVLDLLPESEIRAWVSDAARALVPGGLLCLVSLTHGASLLSGIVVGAWRLLFRIAPRLVGGCRPIELLDFVPRDVWEPVHRRVVVSWGVASEVVVAKRRNANPV